MKTCRSCGEDKEESEFYLTSGGKLRGVCKPCYNSNTVRNTRARRYGLTVDEMEEALTAATHCAVCGGEFFDDSDKHIDHSHATGRFRDVLCGLCNCGIGFLREDPVLMRAAAKYVIKHNRLDAKLAPPDPAR